MLNLLKKGLVFLLILVIASILFNVSANNNVQTSASEVVEIIENEEEVLQDGYIEENVQQNENSNIFVTIISAFSNLITAIFSALLSLISKIISSFTG